MNKELLDIGLLEKKEKLILIFRNTEMNFDLDRAATARELVRLQSDRWKDLLNKLIQEVSIAYSDEGEYVSSLFSAIHRIILNAQHSLFRISEDRERCYIHGSIPIITEDATDLFQLGSLYCVGGIIAEIFSVLKPSEAGRSTDLEIFNRPFPPLLTLEVNKYQIDREAFTSNLTKKNRSIVAQMERYSDEFGSLLLSASQKIQENEELAADQLKTILEESDKSSEKRIAGFEEFLANAKQNIEAARAAALESSTLTGATDVWSKKYNRHNSTFYLTSGMLVVLVVGLLFGIYQNFSALKSAIPVKNDGDVAYGFVLLLAVPVIASAWVIKIFTRWATSSLALSEDSGQRKAMIETYLRLVSDPKAHMEQADRIIILNALFRPLPGAAQEDLSPPTIADFLKDTLSGKKS